MEGVHAFLLIVSNFFKQKWESKFLLFHKIVHNPSYSTGYISGTADVARPVIKLKGLFHNEGKHAALLTQASPALRYVVFCEHGTISIRGVLFKGLGSGFH